MCSDIKEHAKQYKEEKKVRWKMAKDGEEVAIQKICKIFSEKLSIAANNITFIRYDELWFNIYDINLPYNEWVKGAPDYLIKIALEKEKYLLVEIKLKSQEYRKTKYGGMTKNKSSIPNYGCNSFYLDIIPVFRNMNSFIKSTNIKATSFIIAFVREDFSEINIISLAKINALVLKGWQKDRNTRINICKFGEGYGQDTYLIPKDATINTDNLTTKIIEKIASNKYPSPKK